MSPRSRSGPSRWRPQDVLRLALERFGRKVALSSSFGAEDMVLIDMILKIDPRARIFTLDTGRLPQETYNVIDATREKYGATIEVFFPQPDAVQDMVADARHEPVLSLGREPQALLRRA